MLLSKACIYGIRASLYLASSENGNYISINQISENLDISYHFLTKIFQKLNKAGLLESLKGPNGGVRLSRDGTDIYLVEIVGAIDGLGLLSECALGLAGCGTATPCPLHEQWSVAKNGLSELLENTALEELVQKGKSGNLRISPDGDFDWVLEE